MSPFASRAAAGALAIALATPFTAGAQDLPFGGGQRVTLVPRVRPLDSKAAALLEAGRARSATFRHLLDTLERSDLVVHVEACELRAAGRFQFVVASPGGRYVRVSIRRFGTENELLPALAHELWHAVEIANVPDVRCQASLEVFYRRVGWTQRADYGVDAETAEAQHIQTVVLRELGASWGAGSRSKPWPRPVPAVQLAADLPYGLRDR